VKVSTGFGDALNQAAWPVAVVKVVFHDAAIPDGLENRVNANTFLDHSLVSVQRDA